MPENSPHDDGDYLDDESRPDDELDEEYAAFDAWLYEQIDELGQRPAPDISELWAWVRRRRWKRVPARHGHIALRRTPHLRIYELDAGR